MSYTAEDLEDLAKKIQYDLTTAKARLSELQRMIAWATQNVPSEKAQFICPKCGLSKPTAEMMDDHLANVHGGPREAVA